MASLIFTWRESVAFFLSIFLFQLISFVSTETVLGEKSDEFDFDGMPGVLHNFAVEIPGGQEECFFQTAAANATFATGFEVFDEEIKVDFYIRNGTTGEVIKQVVKKDSDYIQTESPRSELYVVCIDNVYTRFSAIKVHFFVHSVVMWQYDQYLEELEQINVTVGNFRTSIDAVQKSLSVMVDSELWDGARIVKDYILIMTLNYYVQVWSVLQCVVIVVSAVGQVYSLRRFFNTSDQSRKMRA